MEAVSWERVIPDALDEKVSFQRNVLRQHLERYHFAAKFVRDAAVIDGACGSGYGSEILLRAGAKSVVGIDLDRGAIEYARRRYAQPGISFVQGNLEEVDLRQYPFDVFVSFETIEHLDKPQGFLTKVYNQLPKGGLFIGSVPVVPTVDIDEYHKHDFSRQSWRALVEAVGFDILEELPQQYRATLAEMREEMKAPNTLPGARKGQGIYYMRHPLQAIRRVFRMVRYGLELDMLTVVAQKP